jgi:hypothetical protein
VLSAGVLVGAGWWLGRQQSPGPLPAQVQRGGERPADAREGADDLGINGDIAAPPALAEQAPHDAAGGASLAALPPLDSPVVSVFDDLAERARRGDARAACRLAVELQRCRMAGFMGGGSRRLERMAAREEDEQRRESMINELARIEAERARSEAVCSGLDTQQLDQAFAYQQQAAQAMPELRTWAATQPALNFMKFVNELESWQQYRNSALPWLEAAAASGDLAAIAALARVHGVREPRQLRMPPISQPDDERFLVYAGLMERSGVIFPELQRELDRVRGELDPTALARVQQQVEQLAPSLPATPAAQGPGVQRILGGGTPDPRSCE